MRTIFKKSASLIGLDIRPAKIILLKLKHSRYGLSVDQVATAALTSPIFKDSNITQFDELTQALLEINKTNRLFHHAVAISLTANLIKLGHIKLPIGLTEKMIEAEIDAQVERELPGLKEDLSIDYIESSSMINEKEIQFAITRQAYLSRYVQCVNAAEFKVKIVDIDIYAIHRALLTLQLIKPSDCIQAIIHVVEKNVYLIIIKGDIILFHQQWDLIENNFNEQLKHYLQICIAACPQNSISDLFFCMDSHYREFIAADKEFKAYGIHFVNPFAKIKIGKDVDGELLINHPNEYLLALGLAMREIPTW